MPILTCPTCGSKLEVADEDVGHTVQCGSCQQTFTAEDPDAKKNDGASKKPYAFKDREEKDDDDRPSRRRSSSRDRGDEDDGDRDSGYRPRRSRSRDGDDDYENRYGPPQQTGMGITSMILGILSIPFIFCYGLGIVLAILAVIFGILSLKTAGRGMGIAGIITAVLSLLLFAAMIVFVIVASANRAGGGGAF